MTLYLWFMTKTWVGLLCLLHGFPPSTNDISRTFQHTDLLTTLTVNKPSWTPTLLGQLKKRFSTIITNHDNSRLLDSTPKDKLLLPYMKPLPKVHELYKPVSYDNLTKLTGRPIITAHRWITCYPSRLLGTELASIILQLKTFLKNETYHIFNLQLI